jgi:hypothetical protein
MWINPQTMQVFTTHSEIRSAFPSVSFPTAMSEEDIESVGVMPVTATAQPAFDIRTQKVVEVSPIQSSGVWTQQWFVVSLDAEQIAAKDAAQASAVRSERNAKLAASDWTQLADTTADKTAWAAYRQDLRDVTAQAGFPWTINWPTQPE